MVQKQINGTTLSQINRNNLSYKNTDKQKQPMVQKHR